MINYNLGAINVTSQMGRYKRVKTDGKLGWFDMLTEITWFDNVELPLYNNYDAVATFPDSLPTIEEFMIAEANGFLKVVPNMKDKTFWTSTYDVNNPDFARVFFGSGGGAGYERPRLDINYVRTIKRKLPEGS